MIAHQSGDSDESGGPKTIGGHCLWSKPSFYHMEIQPPDLYGLSGLVIGYAISSPPSINSAEVSRCNVVYE